MHIHVLCVCTYTYIYIYIYIYTYACIIHTAAGLRARPDFAGARPAYFDDTILYYTILYYTIL